LVVVFDNLAVLIADTPGSCLHQCVTSPVVGADVAVYSGPAFVALASVVSAHRSILAMSKRAAQRLKTVVATEPVGAGAFSVVLVAVGILGTSVGG
jgi:hypothetical protein